ncbi:hypothetical protein OROGR_006089 [Orobanche gracilis]
MTDDSVFSSANDTVSSNPGIQITMEPVSENSEELVNGDGDGNGDEEYEIETNEIGNVVKSDDIENAINRLDSDSELGIDCADLENNSDHVLEFESNNHGEQMLEIRANDTGGGIIENRADDAHQHKSYIQPVVGMEFESYDDAYNYYNCYARELGFGIRVKSSWTKRNSKEKRGAVLSCNCEGFKTMKEATTRRKETRTGCLAMVRLRLVESGRWRLDEVKLEHNHLFDHERAQSSRSHKKMEVGAKRKFELAADVQVQTIKLYRAPAVDEVSYAISNEGESTNHSELFKCLKLGRSGGPALCNYFRQAQLTDPNFFYIMDLSDEGFLKNVFWIDSRSRAAYGYFGDVVVVDETCLSNNHDIPLLVFSGLNHHGRSVLFGCGLLADETMDAYVWLMRAWLTCMLGRPPQTIVTDQSKTLNGAISEVFPRAHHRLCLPRVMRSILLKLGEVGESEIFQAILNRTVYDSLKTEEFETAWEEMTQHFAVKNHEWLRSLYEDRERWVPAYLKDTRFTGIYTFQPGESMNSYFCGYLQEQMTWEEFFNVYESVREKKIQKETFDDIESRNFRPMLRTTCSYERQLSELYSKKIFLKFQEEVVLMSNCFSVTQIHISGQLSPIWSKNGMLMEMQENQRTSKLFMINVLGYNGLEEIPNQYILTRWRKDLKRLYTIDPGSNNIDISNPIQWFDHLYRRAMQVVAEGMASQDHHTVAWQTFKESLNKVRLVAAEKPL